MPRRLAILCLTSLVLLPGHAVAKTDAHTGVKSGVKSGAKSEAKSETKSETKSEKHANKGPQSFEAILKSYAFVADFYLKEPERSISDELFWRYPWKVPTPEFPIFPEFDDPKIEMPQSKGAGRAVQHINRGRALYLEGEIEEARRTWLSARARYGKDWPYHRRNDYFVGYAFMRLATADMANRKVGWEDKLVEGAWSNAATFLSWAFSLKKDEADPVVDAAMPKGLYNLAAIYYRYNRYSGAYGAAVTGLEYLRKTGRKDYRPWFRRLIAESYVQNRTYLEALQEFDTALRQDPDRAHAAAIFMRVGDVYFDLNNYELAEEVYRLSSVIDEELRNITPAQLIFRGESLFWLGKFDEAQRMFHMALDGIPFRRVTAPVPSDFAAYARLRMADAWLAQKNRDKAKLEYFKVNHEFRGSEAARIAAVRLACLELPFYEGNNIRHARELLEQSKEEAQLPEQAKELSWACHTASWAERERTRDMVERVRTFATKYPESRFLRSLAEPVREVQAARIEDYFSVGDAHRAARFFEMNRKALFPEVPESVAARLFIAYANTLHSEKAAEFWEAHHKTPDSDLKLLREAVVSAENLDREASAASQKGKRASVWQNRLGALASKVKERKWTVTPDGRAVDYWVRLGNSKSAQGLFLGPLVDLARSWSATDLGNMCLYEFPLVARTMSGLPQERVRALAREMIDRTLPALLQKDESCASSLLEMEARLWDPASLAAMWRARLQWPMTQPVLAQIWSVAEALGQAGDRKGAEEFWKVLSEKAPKGSVESGLAKARLDPTRTEFESLWN